MRTRPAAPRRGHSLRMLLEQRRRVVLDELHQVSLLLRSEPASPVADEAEQASRALHLGLESQRITQLTRTLQQIEDALSRHAIHRYGFCVACGDTIPMRRLRSLPMTRHCRRCQECVEQRASRRAA